MNDIAVLGIFFACVLSTLGLVRGCEWLRPTSLLAQPRKESRATTLVAEERQ